MDLDAGLLQRGGFLSQAWLFLSNSCATSQSALVMGRVICWCRPGLRTHCRWCQEATETSRREFGHQNHTLREIFLGFRFIMCVATAVMQVPFIAWTADIPFAGRGVQRALAAAARPFASYVMATTGTQFFLQDGTDGDPPLLVPALTRCPPLSPVMVAMGKMVVGHVFEGIVGAGLLACNLIWGVRGRLHNCVRSVQLGLHWEMGEICVQTRVQVRLTQDRPGDGYYHSALKAFVTRTCYANSSGLCAPIKPSPCACLQGTAQT